MKECPMLVACIFFNDKMANMPNTAEILKNKFCKGQYIVCARYIVCMSLGKEKVPSNLFPGEIEVAKLIISKK
jgi:hypothetical protein